LDIPTSAVAVKGNYAYIDMDNTIGIVDVSDPTQPVLVGQTSELFLTTFIDTLKIYNNRLF